MSYFGELRASRPARPARRRWVRLVTETLGTVGVAAMLLGPLWLALVVPPVTRW